MIWRKLICSMTMVALFLAPLPCPSLAGRQNASPQTVQILIYADDYYRSPNTFVDQALLALGKTYTAYHSDQPGFKYALGHGSWDLVIFAHEFYALDSQMYEALKKYASEGGRLIFQSYAVSSYPTDPLWQTLGFTFVEDDLISPDPVYWWKPGYPAFAYPLQVPEFTALVSRPAYTIYGQYVQPRTGFQAWAGYSTPGLNRNQAALIVGNQNRTVFKGFMDAQNTADLDSDGLLDGVELWINLINWILDPVSWGVLRGTIDGLGYCDSAPAVLPYAAVTISPNAGGDFFFITNANGEYEWWTQETGLMDVAVIHLTHTQGTATGIQVSLGGTTTLDFNLRQLAPCVKLSEHRIHRFLKPGESGTAQMSVENLGAGMAHWEVDERSGPFQPPSDIPWVSESPITGTLGANSYQPLDVTLEALPGMLAGCHTGYLVVSSDDPNALALPITVTMVIGSDLLYLPLVLRNP
jgi:hypothetical protein